MLLLAGLVYITELIFLTVLIFGLHYYSKRIGLLPMLFTVTVLTVVVAMSSFLNVFVTFVPSVEFRITGSMFVPLMILGVLIIYIINGDALAHIAFASVLYVSLITTIIVVFFTIYANAENAEVTTSLEVFADFSILRFLHVRVSSLIAFTVAIAGSIIVYQSIRNLSAEIPEFIAVLLAFFCGLWMDTITFLLIREFGLSSMWANIANDMIVKSLISFTLAVPVSVYLHYVKGRHKNSPSTYGRPVFGIIFGTQGEFTQGMRELQSELQVNKQIYQYLTNNLHTIIYLADATGNLLYVSPAFETVLGHKIDILENKVDNFLNVVHPDDRIEPPLLDFMIHQPPNTFRVIRGDGSIGWLNNRLQALYDENGKVIQYLGIAEDLTQDYEHRERELQLELSRERIRIMNDFIRDASHDLKSPLSSMMLKIDMLKRTEGERHSQLQDELQDRVMYLSKLIDDLFTLSLFEGRMNANRESIDLQDITHQTIIDLDAIAQEKSITVSLETAPEACTVMSSRETMQRLMNNLIGNAIRYTQEGQVTIRFTANENTVSFSVSDTGIGIPEDDLDRIFDRFYRSKNAKQHSKKGTGLGLSICRAIVENHNGTITVTSTVGSGTTVTVFLPLNS